MNNPETNLAQALDKPSLDQSHARDSIGKLLRAVAAAVCFTTGCGPGIRTASEQDIERAERTILARMGGGLGVSEDRQSAIGCMIIESDDPEKADEPDVDAKKIEAAMNSLRENNRKGLEAVNQRPLRTRDSNLDSQDLAFDRKGKATKKEACLQSAVEGAETATVPQLPESSDSAAIRINKPVKKAVKQGDQRNATVDPDGMKISKQPYTPQDVVSRTTKLVNQNIGRIKICYIKELMKYPGLKGKIIFKLEISQKGRITRTTFPNDGIVFRNKSMERCIGDITKNWDFSEGEDGDDARMIEYPLTFQ